MTEGLNAARWRSNAHIRNVLLVNPGSLIPSTIPGIFSLYAMALSNNHICPVHNWNYNQSCGGDGPGSCCTLDHIPLALLGERPKVLTVSPLQVDHAKVLHYIGAGVAFPTSMLFLLLQSILTYRMAKTRGQYWTGHLRSILTTVAFVTLVFSGVFFIQESFVLQHVAALCEWMFIIDVLVFYGTFTFEFGAISTETFLVLLKASRAPKSYKGESSVSSTAHIHSLAEGLAMA
ncbi:PREDICTED: transmembrane protein 150A [Chaetura pelagica]|uniref:transmembrane protein 150A n=1 Tax=Chaetura pelagica TaxID=8897 RepID=UPI000523D051|nr:PREDICTED: transmembrane protein 150A [Chaetura pelagica]